MSALLANVVPDNSESHPLQWWMDFAAKYHYRKIEFADVIYLRAEGTWNAGTDYLILKNHGVVSVVVRTSKIDPS